MTGAVDQKTYWGLLETVMWICTRDEQRVAAMWDMNEEKRIALVMFSVKAELDPSSLLVLSKRNSDAAQGVAEPQDDWKSSRIDEPVMMRMDQALDGLLKKVHSRRVQMTAIRCDRSSDEQIPVPLAEQNDLTFRISPGDRVMLVGLWSRSRGILVWRSRDLLAGGRLNLDRVRC
jgi:hypothetical protein